ncbi:exportin-2-like [Vicia villosa]|uniref:exportin-2-like n=1 Tax=Vicia villosa TaxID=3911 RepID=UPI00273BC72F|nr:exportin-2-like [Vicia villosa]
MFQNHSCGLESSRIAIDIEVVVHHIDLVVAVAWFGTGAVVIDIEVAVHYISLVEVVAYASNTQDDDDDGDMEDEDQLGGLDADGDSVKSETNLNGDKDGGKPQDDLELSDTESDLDQTLQFLSQRFRNTRSPAPNPRRQAESSLSEAANTPNFGLVVLRLIVEPVVDAQIRQSAAVNFKNHLRLRWALEERSILEAEKEHIKTLSVSLTLSVSSKTHYQLSEALTIIGKHDFPKAWPTLLPELVASLQNASQSHSNDLWIDLKHFVDNFVAPLLDILLKTVLFIDAAATAVSPPPVANLRQLFESRKLYCNLFADHVREWMSGFRKYLTTSYPILEGNGDGLALVDELRASDCDNINHYMEKYEEEFKGFLNDFALVMWTLLGNVSQSSSRDQLAITAIKFFTTISTDIRHNLFAPDRIIPRIFQGIVIPNVRLREDDEELFEINLIEYIRRVRKAL